MTAVPALAKYLRDWRTFPGDAAIAYRIEGVRGVWDEIAPRTVHRAFRVGHMVVYGQPLTQACEIAPPVGVTITTATETDWPAMASLTSGRNLARFRALAANGRHCLVAWRGSQPIGYGWIAERIGPDVTACDWALPAYAAYLWDLYVIPGERRTGVGSALARARIRKARELGFREGWRMISSSNRASLRTLANSSTGTRVVGELRYIKLLTHMHTRFTPTPVSGGVL